jgi:hypothetical protein
MSGKLVLDTGGRTVLQCSPKHLQSVTRIGGSPCRVTTKFNKNFRRFRSILFVSVHLVQFRVTQIIAEPKQSTEF